MKIYMDDLRPCPKGWVLARTTDEFIDLMVKNRGKVETISLDHDMGEPVQDGYWVVKQMVELGLSVDKAYLHTANPVGRENMFWYLFNANKHGTIKCKVNKSPFMFNEDECGGNGTDF